MDDTTDPARSGQDPAGQDPAGQHPTDQHPTDQHPTDRGALTGAQDPAALAEQLNTSGRGALGERMGIRFVHASPDLVVATMPVEGNTQPYGLLHGGASCVLAETLGSVGSALHAASRGGIAVGLDINATHHRAARAGVVTGTARPLHRGGSVASYEVVITDETGERICTARISCLLRAQPPR